MKQKQGISAQSIIVTVFKYVLASCGSLLFTVVVLVVLLGIKPGAVVSNALGWTLNILFIALFLTGGAITTNWLLNKARRGGQVD